MSYYSKMKDNRKKTANKMKDRANKENSSGGYNDDKDSWRLTRDKADNGFAVIRFLPTSEKDFEFQSKAAAADNIELDPEDVLPWVLVYKHGFKNKGKWFINECPRTIGKDCPVCEKEKALIDDGVGWATELREHEDRKIYGQRKGKKQYWSNILIVKDSAHPENEGTVKKFSYGEKIHSKLIRAMNPEFEDEDEMNPFCPWDGADFKLKAQRKDGYVNYDSSDFTAPCMMADTDEEIEKVLASMFFLGDLLDPKKYKSYEKLDADYERVVNAATPKGRKSIDDDGDGGVSERKTSKRVDDAAEPEEKPKPARVRRTRSEAAAEESAPPKKTEDVKKTEDDDADDDGDGVDYFKSLLDED